jgi:hypothetical protein
VDGDCHDGNCVDGYCCDGVCNGPCEACNVTKGKCAPVSVAIVSAKRTPCVTDGTMCGGSCDGKNGTACVYAGSSTTCRPAGCANAVAYNSASCNGTGICPASSMMTSCAPYSCGATVCNTAPCNTDFQCSGANYCDGTMVCSPWTPAVLGGLQLWLQGDHVSSTNGTVTFWGDDSSVSPANSARPFTGAAPTAVANGINGHVYVSFGAGGSSTGMYINDAASLQWGAGPFLIAVVNRFTNSGDGIIYAKVNPTVPPYYGPALFAGYTANGHDTAYVGQIQSGSTVATMGGYNTNAWHYVSYYRDLSNTNTVRVDGNTAGQTVLVMLDVSAAGQPAALGRNSADGSQPLRGDIAELIAATGAPTAVDLARIDRYLKDKYGL